MSKVNFLRNVATIVACLAAMVSAMAQMTPEAAIGNTPELPSYKTLASSDESSRATVKAFLMKIHAIDSAYTKNVTPEITDADVADVKAQAEKQAKEMTGYSVEQLQNMSEAQQAEVGKKAAQKKMDEVNSQLSALGLGNLEQMANMSESDLTASMSASMGLTPAEMEAMSKMNDKEIEVYMKQGDRVQRVQNSKLAKNAQKTTSNQPKINPNDMGLVQQAAEDHQAYMQKFNDLINLIKDEHTELAKQFAAKEERTQKAIENSTEGKIVAGCDGKTTYTNAQCEAAYAAVKARWQACREECFTLWINQIVKEQGRIKALLPEARRVDEQNKEAQQAQARISPSSVNAISQKMQGFQLNTSSLVSAYLNTTANVTEYPVER